MSATPWTFTNVGETKLLDGTFDINSDSWKMALFQSTSNIGPSSTTYAGLTNEVASANGYTTGGIAVTLTLSGTTTVKVDISVDPSWMASGGSIAARWAVIYEVGGDVLCYSLLDEAPADVTATSGNPLTVAASASGVFTMAPLSTGDVVGPSSSVASEIALFDGTTGKLIKRATGTGVVHATSGVYSVSVVVLTSEVSGVLPLANGGTNSTDYTTTTVTLTNKRVRPRVTTITSSATPTPDSDASDEFTVTAQAAAAAFAAPSGTPVEGQRLLIRIKDNATARALTWDSVYRASSDLPLPSTTVLSKTLYMLFVYNFTDTKWDLLAVLNNF